MHLSFESLAVIDAPNLQTSLMDIHHDTSLMCILEDDSIFLTSRARIYSCSSKGVGLWLVVRPFICLFRIAHFIFTLALHFCLSLIQPSRFSLFTCKCAHKLDAFGMHLIRCLFADFKNVNSFCKYLLGPCHVQMLLIRHK
jgi:hypothetical protein